jgi:hypothetical protein
MKPWQTPLSIAPSKAEKKEQRERTQVWAKRTEPKLGHRRALEQILSQSSLSQKAESEKKEKSLTSLWQIFWDLLWNCSEHRDTPNIFIIHTLWELTSLLSAVEVLKYMDWSCWNPFFSKNLIIVAKAVNYYLQVLTMDAMEGILCLWISLVQIENCGDLMPT